VYSVPDSDYSGGKVMRASSDTVGRGSAWQANWHLWFQADYGIFYAGKFVKEKPVRRNLNYWAYGRHKF